MCPMPRIHFLLKPALISLSALLYSFGAPVGAGAQQLSRAALAEQDQFAVQRLQQSFDPATGLWGKEGWWHDANSLTALIDSARATGSRQYLPAIERTYAANIARRFLINKFYDDEGWWALAWIDAYDLTGDQHYLAAASTIFQDMTSGWDNTCGGGLWWTRDRTYKNAIPNELFLSVSARLANRSEGRERENYIQWADREWKWLQHSPMLEDDHLFSDGLDSSCHDNHRRKWSYNQGVVLGGLAELAQVPGHAQVMAQAEAIADAAMAHFSDTSGILHESCEPRCSGDGTQFKGIFIRNLAQLDLHAPQARYADFIRANADSLVAKAQASDHSFGLVWSGPPGKTDSITQTSAIDALNAALFTFQTH